MSSFLTGLTNSAIKLFFYLIKIIFTISELFFFHELLFVNVKQIA